MSVLLRINLDTTREFKHVHQNKSVCSKRSFYTTNKQQIRLNSTNFSQVSRFTININCHKSAITSVTKTSSPSSRSASTDIFSVTDFLSYSQPFHIQIDHIAQQDGMGKLEGIHRHRRHRPPCQALRIQTASHVDLSHQPTGLYAPIGIGGGWQARTRKVGRRGVVESIWRSW
jgi:hypothetical protein